jgi:hypothetical protein
VSCFVLPFLLIWAVAFISHMRFYWSIAPAALSRWAEENGYQIERQRAPIVFEGPYAWNAGGFRRVYRVTVRDRDQHPKHGWVRFGRSWLTRTVGRETIGANRIDGLEIRLCSGA